VLVRYSCAVPWRAIWIVPQWHSKQQPPMLISDLDTKWCSRPTLDWRRKKKKTLLCHNSFRECLREFLTLPSYQPGVCSSKQHSPAPGFQSGLCTRQKALTNVESCIHLRPGVKQKSAPVWRVGDRWVSHFRHRWRQQRISSPHLEAHKMD